MSEMQIQSVLQQMRAMSQSGRIEQSGRSEGVAPVAPVTGVRRVEGEDFASKMKEAVRYVNDVQQDATTLQTRFELGDNQVSLPQVMIAMNKSTVAFEATNQVRNRLLSAYQEVMSMQV
ncbi:flagellar hook-basal body complex protein FliE [Thiobaca trueperi]|uniref:Flagellar hook-basal body complex protein FliE n=1 Tax=Thiobaca trueperi TaxID=127458 RepID=A0A4R3MY02_9GAMM|nr:flagellar hook-basal body complex protein FliE [Thiobaca trueperi]TCT21235.1 flagellar hook-basal body complex protein FliE [Thiobaca trueperi]